MYRTFLGPLEKNLQHLCSLSKERECQKLFFIVFGKNDVDGLQEAGRDKDHYTVLGILQNAGKSVKDCS
jgi:hypothetical protein